MNKKIIIPAALLLLFSLTSCDGSSSSSNASNDSNDTSASNANNSGNSSSQIINKELSVADFQKAIDYSNPSQINTNQTFTLDKNDVVLHFNSSLTIEYASSIKTCYSYSYEKLNEIVTGKESFISTVSNTLYSEGSAVYDGVKWVYDAEEATTLIGVKLNEQYATMAIDGNTLSGSVVAGKEKNFFGADYGVNTASFSITLEEGKLKNVILSFKTNLDFIGDSATVNSATSFSYNPQTIVIPQ